MQSHQKIYHNKLEHTINHAQISHRFNRIRSYNILSYPIKMNDLYAIFPK